MVFLSCTEETCGKGQFRQTATQYQQFADEKLIKPSFAGNEGRHPMVGGLAAISVLSATESSSYH
jgi:hypothetical protein